MNPTTNIFNHQGTKGTKKAKTKNDSYNLFKSFGVRSSWCSWCLGVSKFWMLSFLLVLSFLLFPVWSLAQSTTPSSAQSQDWTYKKYLKAFKKSHRVTHLTASEFDRVQERKPAMMKDIRRYLWRKFGGADPRLMKAFQELPREYYHFDYQGGVDFSKNAYEYPPRTWALGWGSALSDYEGQAYMAQLAHPTSKDTVLEVGTG
ncbi:MAG TPA: hypothetical protein VN963_09195, partial [bacterium]|nr:hypothetical protein [bacterium]